MQIDHPILQFKNVSISYTPGKNAVNHVNADIKKNRITAIMGPSGCGKSTLLRAINRMHELYPDIRISGEILMDNRNILKMNPMEVRRMAGMVFQRPNPFPTMSIFDNVIAGYKLNGIRLKKKEKEEIVETCLTNVGLWNEVKDALFKKGTFLSGGQQQRLCIARALALKPEVLLMDLRPRSYRHQPDRRIVTRAEKRIYHYHRHPQHVASCPYFRLFDVYVSRRTDRIRQNPDYVYQSPG